MPNLTSLPQNLFLECHVDEANDCAECHQIEFEKCGRISHLHGGRVLFFLRLKFETVLRYLVLHINNYYHNKVIIFRKFINLVTRFWLYLFTPAKF